MDLLDEVTMEKRRERLSGEGFQDHGDFGYAEDGERINYFHDSIGKP